MSVFRLLATTGLAGVLGVAASGAVTSVAWAQSIDTVDELVVTAQKREQNLQDVPIVVTSLSEELLEDAGVRDIRDLQILTPGLSVNTNTSEAFTVARIRGVGTVGNDPGLESSVGVVIDGVYRPRNGVAFGDLGEMQRIEVLKGPQGTLFGKNTSAGVINVLSKAPSFDFGAQGELTVGDHGARGAAASVTGPLAGDTLAGRLYVARRERDGLIDVVPGDGPRSLTEDQDRNFWTARGQLLFLPSDTVEIRLIGDYTKREEHCCAAVQVRSGSTAGIVNALAAGGQGVRPAVNGGAFGPAPGYQMLPFSRTAYANRDTGQDIEDKGVSVEANVDLDPWNATLTSVTAVRSWSVVSGQDSDFSGADIVYRDKNGDWGFAFDTLSQEVRLAGATERLDWLVGGYYASEDLDQNNGLTFGADYNDFLSRRLTQGSVPPSGLSNRLGCFTAAVFSPACIGAGAGQGPVFAAGGGTRDRYAQSSKTFALFTNNSLRLTEALELTVGLRYTMDDKQVHVSQANYGGNGAACAAALAGTAPAGAKTLICLPFANPAFDGRSYTQDIAENAWSGTLKAAYRFSDDVMAYASYARGYKAGGFNLDRAQLVTTTPVFSATPIDDTSFASETVDSYELGVKTTWLDGKLLLNAAAFREEFTDFQLNTFVGTNFVVEAIPSLVSQGVDADMIWFAPVDGLSFQGGVTWAETEFGEFGPADLKSPASFPSVSLLPGAQASAAPEWSATGAVTYERSFGGLKAGFNLSAKYTSENVTGSDLIPAKLQPDMTLLNGRVSLASEDDRWTLELWAQNLTDVEYYEGVFNQPLQGAAMTTALQPDGSYYNPALDTQTYAGVPGQPRTWGATLRFKY